MAADLPPDILAEIFSRLPVKSLLRFRSTSKSLKSLIDSYKFINLHLKNNSLSRSLIIPQNFDLYQLQIDDDDDFSKSIIPLNHPFTTNIAPVTCIGSCNGLLAISNGVNEITFWNLAPVNIV